MQIQRTDSARSKEERIYHLLGLGDISIDEEGRVWRHGKRVGKTFSPYRQPRRIDLPDAAGYRIVKLTLTSGKRFSTSAHRIQWVKHHNSIPDGFEINHKDMDKDNNRIENLELATRKENIRHARQNREWRHKNRGEEHDKSILTWEAVRFIREEVGSGRATQKAMADKFGVNPVLISQVMSNKRWKREHDPAFQVSGT